MVSSANGPRGDQPARGDRSAQHASGARVGRAWATSATVRDKVRKRWDDGTLLRAVASGGALEPIEVPLGGPRASELGDRLGEVQDWIADLESGRRGGARFDLRYKQIGGRAFGKNAIPSHAVVSSFDQAWALLDVRPQVRQFQEMLSSAPDDRVAQWLLAAPVTALSHAGDWPALIAAFGWLDASRRSGRYLRQIDAPGVDTKLVESRRSVLASMLGVSGQATGFLTDLGLSVKPEYVRMRLASGVASLSVSELSVRVSELESLPVDFTRAVVVENEITYLTIPVPGDGIVIWGRGFDVARLGRWEKLRDAEIDYWGDLDTHGFAILNRLRSHLPRTRSFLMDSDTLHSHRGRWGSETKPTSGTLSMLTAEEAAVYDDLVCDRFGDKVRLEQERISWDWVLEHLPYRAG